MLKAFKEELYKPWPLKLKPQSSRSGLGFSPYPTPIFGLILATEEPLYINMVISSKLKKTLLPLPSLCPYGNLNQGLNMPNLGQCLGIGASVF